MDLTRVILGPVTTEKSELLKGVRTYTLRVSPLATKVDVRNALKRYYDVEVTSIRVMRTRPKQRMVGNDRIVTKRHRQKRMMVTLSKESKTLDLAQFKAA
jgi:large subunit ribosomal protein L23